MIKIISILILVLFIVLLPPAVLAYASQDAIPGDGLYPVKRKLEDLILGVVSINPISKAWFALAYSRRRFSEATSLLDKNDRIGASLSYKELVVQTQSVATQVQQVKDSSLRTQLNKSILEYQQGLKDAKQKVARNTPILTPAPSTPSSSPNPDSSKTISTPPPSSPDDDFQKKLDDYYAQLEKIRKENEAAAAAANVGPNPTPDTSDLAGALQTLDGIDVDGLSKAFSDSMQRISSFATQ